jgi:hypothetical protein
MKIKGTIVDAATGAVVAVSTINANVDPGLYSEHAMDLFAPTDDRARVMPTYQLVVHLEPELEPDVEPAAPLPSALVLPVGE